MWNSAHFAGFSSFAAETGPAPIATPRHSATLIPTREQIRIVSSPAELIYKDNLRACDSSSIHNFGWTVNRRRFGTGRCGREMTSSRRFANCSGEARLARIKNGGTRVMIHVVAVITTNPGQRET